jgi:hypothetical protein
MDRVYHFVQLAAFLPQFGQLVLVFLPDEGDVYALQLLLLLLADALEETPLALELLDLGPIVPDGARMFPDQPLELGQVAFDSGVEAPVELGGRDVSEGGGLLVEVLLLVGKAVLHGS